MVALIRTLLFLCLPVLVSGQSELRIGEWRAFLPYQVGNTVTQDDDHVYYGSVNGLLKINKDTRDVSFFSKVEGLSDVGIRLVKYHEPTETLIIVYEDSGIDLITSTRIEYVDDIRNAMGINGSKRVNHVFADNSDQVYLSCAFGLVELNLRTLKFGFTTFTPSAVNGFTKYADAYYVATDDGIFRFDKFGVQLPANFAAWSFLSTDDGLPASYGCQSITVFGGVLFAGIGGDLYRDDNGFYVWDTYAGHIIEFLSPEGSQLMAGFRCPDNTCNGKVRFYSLEMQTNDHGFNCTGLPTYALEDELGQIWYADEYPGIRVAADVIFGCEPLSFNAPYSDKVSEVAIKDGVLYVATGGVTDSYGYLNRKDGFLIRKDDTWSYFNHTNFPELGAQGLSDYLRILPHPDTSKLYVGSFFAGLVEYDFGTFRFYDQTNSLLQGAVGDPNSTRVSGLVFDDSGNLWISNYLAPRPIVVKKSDNTWTSFNVPKTELAQVVIDQRGYKWFAVISVSEGVLVYDDGGTIDAPGDDRYKYLNTNNSALPTNLLATLAVDRGGDVWVGTREGPVVFDGAQDPFSSESQGYRVRVDQDGVLSYLLFEEEVTAIAIDGANRKWLGTHNGIFLQSPDGETEIARFNTENSPLLDNNITDIEIDQTNGDVYIGTDAGINVVRTDAIAGRAVHSNSAYAFPNPVRPEYEGPIAIRGLAEDAIVKITDIHGTVIYETLALGGQAIWYGRDLDGQRAASGVYLVFSTTQSQFDKPDAIVTKILMVK